MIRLAGPLGDDEWGVVLDETPTRQVPFDEHGFREPATRPRAIILKLMRRLGDLEAEIMNRLWDWGQPATVREIVDDINKSRPVAYTTVTTVADTLYRKGWLMRWKNGRAWTYEPVRSREDYTVGLMQDALGSSADRQAALLRFVEHMSAEDAQTLDEALRTVGRYESGGAADTGGGVSA